MSELQPRGRLDPCNDIIVPTIFYERRPRVKLASVNVLYLNIRVQRSYNNLSGRRNRYETIILLSTRIIRQRAICFIHIASYYLHLIIPVGPTDLKISGALVCVCTSFRVVLIK